MTNDNDIQQLFSNYRPKANPHLVEEVKKKMEVVDMVRGVHQEQVRWMQWLAIASLVTGLVIGFGLMYIVFFRPIDWSLLPNTAFGMLFSPNMLLFLSRYGELVLSLLATASIIIGALPLILSSIGISIKAIQIRHNT